MAVKRRYADIDVVKAAETRIKNVFANGVKVYLSFSGGKDSLVLAQLILDLASRGEINPAQLVVHFIDEEAIFPCIERTVLEWRKKFILIGATFEWYCIEVKHYNCFNELSNDETFICWDSRRRDVWVRKPPKFAITSHPMLRPRKDAYQDFLPRSCSDGITLVGIRMAESIHRLKSIATMTSAGKKITARRQIFPIYDWTDRDVWLYIKEQNVDIPEIYLYLWQIGTKRNGLRVSQFFSIDTARSLVKMNEYYPNLMDRIIQREPNAYLAALYWDSEMFGRRSRTRRELEGETEKDYKTILIDLFNHMDVHFDTPNKRKVAESYRKFFMGISSFADNKDFRMVYEGLIGGDPKLRNYRALYQRIYSRYIENAKKAREVKKLG